MVRPPLKPFDGGYLDGTTRDIQFQVLSSVATDIQSHCSPLLSDDSFYCVGQLDAGRRRTVDLEYDIPRLNAGV